DLGAPWNMTEDSLDPSADLTLRVGFGKPIRLTRHLDPPLEDRRQVGSVRDNRVKKRLVQLPACSCDHLSSAHRANPLRVRRSPFSALHSHVASLRGI